MDAATQVRGSAERWGPLWGARTDDLLQLLAHLLQRVLQWFRIAFLEFGDRILQCLLLLRVAKCLRGLLHLLRGILRQLLRELLPKLTEVLRLLVQLLRVASFFVRWRC